jgi:hypothetical protein
MQISKCNVISGYGKFWTLDEIFQWKKSKYHILPPLDGFLQERGTIYNCCRSFWLESTPPMNDIL